MEKIPIFYACMYNIYIYAYISALLAAHIQVHLLGWHTACWEVGRSISLKRSCQAMMGFGGPPRTLLSSGRRASLEFVLNATWPRSLTRMPKQRVFQRGKKRGELTAVSGCDQDLLCGSDYGGGQWSCSWALANHHLTSTLAPSKYNSAIVRKLNRCKLLLYRTILWGIRTQTNGLQRQLLRVPTPGRNYSYPRTKGQDQSNMHQILNSAHIFPDRSYYQDAPTVPSYISDRSWSFFPCSFSLENRGELCFTFVFNLLIITLQKTSHYLLFFPFSSDHFLTMEMHKLLNMALPSGCSQSCWKQLTYSVRCQGEVQTSSTLLHKPRWTVQHGLTFHWIYVPIHMTSKFQHKSRKLLYSPQIPKAFCSNQYSQTSL